MLTIEDKFRGLGVDNAPGQEVRQAEGTLALLTIGGAIAGEAVDFSHGDVNEDAFAPTPGAFAAFAAGFERGGVQAYTEYRGAAEIREQVAAHLAAFTGAPVDAKEELIITPGTQGALFLAVMANVAAGDKVAIVQPDYFANRKLVEFAGGAAIPIRMAYLDTEIRAGLDLAQLEQAFKAGAKTFLFSNPNNPTGVVYAADEIADIARLASHYGATVIIDQLYSRLLYPGQAYTHLRAATDCGDACVLTIMGPSKTESLSGFRLGVAFGPAHLLARMEKLQAIVSLRAPGYCQAVLKTWFVEPDAWLNERIFAHQTIRDALVDVFRAIEGVRLRLPQAGSYLFPRLPALSVPTQDFVRLLRAQANVIVTPGTEFSPHSSDSIRLNFSQNPARAIAAVQRIATMAQRYRTVR